MTRDEWMDSIDNFEELCDFCCYEDIELPNLYDEEGKDDFYNEYLDAMASNSDTWQDLLRMLNDIPTGDGWYEYSDWNGEMYPADLGDWVNNVADELEERGFFNGESHPDSRYYDSSEQEEDFEIESEESLFAMITGNEEFVKGGGT